MNEELNTESVRQLLNRSTAQLGQPAVARLRDARALALARHDARSTAPSFAWAGTSASSGHASNPQHKHFYWAAAVVLIACLLSGIAYWQHASEHDTSDVDIAILTDEMPVDVYVD